MTRIVNCWCERGELNPHGLPRQILSLMRLPFRHSRTDRCACMTEQKWSRCRDLNPGPLGPEPSALPNCATPRPRAHTRHIHSIEHGFTRVKRFPESVSESVGGAPASIAWADWVAYGRVVRGMDGNGILYPVGHLFRPSCVGLHRIPENHGPQGTGLGIPSVDVAHGGIRGCGGVRRAKSARATRNSTYVA